MTAALLCEQHVTRNTHDDSVLELGIAELDRREETGVGVGHDELVGSCGLCG